MTSFAGHSTPHRQTFHENRNEREFDSGTK